MTPDVMTVAKGARRRAADRRAASPNPDCADVLEPGDHGSTFAGGPVIAAAANAVLDVLTEPGFLATVAQRGEQLAAGLRDLGLEPRGLGLMIGFDLPEAPDVARRLLARAAAGRARHRPRDDPAAAAADRLRGRGRRGRAPARARRFCRFRARWLHERHTLIKTASYEAEPARSAACCCSTPAASTRRVMLKWIQDEYEAEVVALTVNLGQPGEDYEVVKGKALQLGALDCHVVDAREEFARDYVAPAIKANALYGGGYPLFTALGRPLIAKLAVEYAQKTGCDTIAHGCTGKGNDQVRIESTVIALDPNMKIIAPVRGWQMGREEEIDYAREHGIPVKGGTETPPYSIDDNLWGRSSEGGSIEDLDEPPARRRVPARHPPGGGAGRAAGRDGGLRARRPGRRWTASSSGWLSCSSGPARSAPATASASSTTSRTGSSA